MKIGDVSFYGLFPVIAFTVSMCVFTMVRSLVRTKYSFHRILGATLTIVVATLVALVEALRWRQFDTKRLSTKDFTTLSGFVNTDRLTAISIVVICLLVIIATLVSVTYLKERDDIPAAEFFILLQCVAVGMCAMVMANDLMAMFVALEVFSIPLYVLTAFDRRRVRSLEGGFKYFILGAVSSAIFLYGIALHYGVSGSTAFTAATEVSTVASISTVLILIGLLFKVAAVPFHFWSPDAYQGAPSPVTLFMSAATKLVAFVALVRLVQSQVIDVTVSGASARIVLTVVCIASALFGSIVALRQGNIKRAIAYSSITHTAYILLALKGGTDESLQAVLTYVVIYAFIVAGTFAVISVVSGVNEQTDSLSQFKGLARTNPWLAGSLTVLLFAQAGIPLTSGFIAKFDVFRVAFQEKFYLTGIVILVATVIAAAFYIRIVLALYADSFHDENVNSETEAPSKYIVSVQTSIAIGICVAVTIAVGILPSLVTGLTHAL